MAKAGEWTFDLCGGHLALDFANTVSNRHTSAPIERLETLGDVIRFAVQDDVVSKAEGDRILKQSRRAPEEENARTLHDIIRLREALYAVFAAAAEGKPADRGALSVLNRHVCKMSFNDALEWSWLPGEDPIGACIGRIVGAAFDLLRGPKNRVRICEADDCVWLFYDSSKSGTRRWCDMKVCGNRIKARRFHERHG